MSFRGCQVSIRIKTLTGFRFDNHWRFLVQEFQILAIIGNNELNSRKNPKGTGKRPHSGFLILIKKMVDLYDGSGQHARPFSDFRHLVFPLDGHEVYARNPFHLFEFFNLFQGKLDPFFGRLALSGTS